MGMMVRTRVAALLCAAVMTSASVAAQPPQADYRPPGIGGAAARDAYDRGYRAGLQQGERDARANRRFETRAAGTGQYRQGFLAGYRVGYGQWRQDERRGRAGRSGYGEPAYARGYADGYRRGLSDARDRDRYDPVRHRDYRSADHGYDRAYGSREIYRNNYRAGFRQGYEDGYRDGEWRR